MIDHPRFSISVFHIDGVTVHHSSLKVLKRKTSAEFFRCHKVWLTKKGTPKSVTSKNLGRIDCMPDIQITMDSPKIFEVTDMQFTFEAEHATILQITSSPNFMLNSERRLSPDQAQFLWGFPDPKPLYSSYMLDNSEYKLVGGFNPFEKYFIVKIDHFPR